MNALIETLTGMDKLSDQVIATDFLVSAKSAVRNYSIALTETTSPEIRSTLRRQLNDAITTHEVISSYMMRKGYYHAYNLQEQFKVDMQTTETALNLAGK
ncbi:spore coat protein [Clostridium sp. CX1]|uniref:Spore coat protein n=1 Tax=Clostridium tanneri TaxID=3037988 RepID=A0ABU4JXH5_9CLOT|nr:MULTISPECIES: spore coat protein [unclassified Clostridium]MCT8975044.1 spore coat protein [Clostridium sp. CX1]MDW8802628.1 spore coat protein [Clostridium sp. A1-XYC3]